MSEKDLAQAAKAKGNAAFSSGHYEDAVKHFTEAISHDPSDAIFFSNRSGAFASLGQPAKALEDAERCLQLNPSFIKGYSRKGLALFTLGRYAEAKAAYQEGLKLDAANASLKEGLDQVNAKLSSPPSSPNANASNPFASMFGPDMWGKLIADPVTKRHLDDPSFVQKMNELQRNPQLFGSYAKDPKVAQALGVLLGMGPDVFQGMGKKGAEGMNEGVDEEGEEDEDDEEGEHKAHQHSQSPHHRSPSSSSPPHEHRQEQKAKEKPESEMTQEEKDKREAEKEKEAGNASFKGGRFDEAISHYEKGAALDPKNIVFLNNMSAAYYEKKEYDNCIDAAKRAIETGREQMSAYKDVAKAWSRIGNAYAAQKKWDEAIEAYEKSSVEDYTDKVREQIKKAKAGKRKQEESAYIDPAKSEEEKAIGNDLYQQGKWIDAIGHYTEALRRNPQNYRVYSNRAACYTKLMDWQRGLDDCEACLKQDPTFVKAYIRKGKIHHYLKQYHKALEAYERGLQIDPNSSELKEERMRTLQAINSGEADPERAKEALKDPEIQQILRDPIIGKVLQDLQNNPSAGQAAMKDKEIRMKIEKLIAAGVLGVK